MMLFYAAQKNHAVERLERILAAQLPAHKVMCCTSLGALEKRLRRPRCDLEIVLILVRDAIEMVRLTEMRALLLDLRLVLVLPKHDSDTVAWAHKLGPRFIAYADGSIDQVAAVLDKMLSKPSIHPAMAE